MIINTNVNMKNANTSLLILTISSLPSNESSKHQTYLNVVNYTFGKWALESISNITITNCSITNRYYEAYETMLSISDSLAWMKFISVVNVSGDEIISVNSTSDITIEMSNFARNKAIFGLLKIES